MSAGKERKSIGSKAFRAGGVASIIFAQALAACEKSEPIPTPTLGPIESPATLTFTPESSPTPTPDFSEFDRENKEFLDQAGPLTNKDLEFAFVKTITRHQPNFYVASLADVSGKEIGTVLGAGCLKNEIENQNQLPKPIGPGEWEINERVDKMNVTMFVAPADVVEKPVLTLHEINYRGSVVECSIPSEEEVKEFFRETFSKEKAEELERRFTEFAKGLKERYGNDVKEFLEDAKELLEDLLSPTPKP